jgi:NADPH-dependent glutamate synthase beta subunit-like oxidoreductase
MEGAGSDYAVSTDAVVIAIGQTPEMGNIADKSLKTGKTGGLAANKNTLETSAPGVFAAGDISATGGTVTEAMAAGRRAATSIDQFLSGIPIEAANESQEIITIKPEQVPAFFTRKDRWEMPRLQPREAIRVFKEVDLGYRDWQAVEEANRCLNCRMCANCIFERGQICFETADRLL